tara:strand:- start:10 stop:873 length:864 start_codon:yes stop_codon:yes gene_type:complete
MFQSQSEDIPTSDQLEIERMYFESIESDVKVNLDEEVPAPPISLSFGTHTYTNIRGTFTEPSVIGTDGNFSFIQAPPKSYKSFFVSLLVSSYLRSGNRWAKDMKSNRKGRDVYHFDTEQGKWHCLKGFRRSSDMAEEQEGYLTYSLRTIDYNSRLKFIEHKLANAEEGTVGLVVIDGIADLVSDVNNIEESGKCVQKLMEMSTKYNCHIVTVIHSNYGSDKPTGHLGSFCEKKTECQISVSRSEDNDKIVNVTCKRSRNASFDDFSFFVNKLGYPEVIEATLPTIDY